jgi:TATA-box binding protein (TBP) (component of TFIID and TFIIIB)
LINICGSFDCEKSIDLINLINNHKDQANYHMECFPAVKFNLDSYIFTIHHTGKVFVTGLKKFEHLEEISNKMYQMIFYFK